MNNASIPQKPPIPPEMLVAGLVNLLDVTPLADGLYQGARKPGGVGRVFGGQVVAQALMAAIKTVGPGKAVHSLHAYFMRGGDEEHPIDYRVEADFDGASFSNRRVVAIQHDKPILNLVASFQRPEQGMAHQCAMPDVPPPEALEDQADYTREHREDVNEHVFRLATRPSPFELRYVGLPTFFRKEKSPPIVNMWFRTRAPVLADQTAHRAILALATDLGLLATALMPHGLNLQADKLQSVSLDHALWFHDDVAVDDWLLYTMDSPWSGQARGFNRGMIFSRDGRLVASCTQEGLIRLRD